jgi:hypothetical protein
MPDSAPVINTIGFDMDYFLEVRRGHAAINEFQPHRSAAGPTYGIQGRRVSCPDRL